MTTISTTINLSSPSSTSASGGADNSLAAKISRLTSQITKLTQQLKDVASGEGSAKEKKTQQELIQVQIKVLQAQLAQLQRQQAEQSTDKNQSQLVQEIGVNHPADGKKIDIYV